MIRLILFDIDGTLLDTGGAGRRAFLTALREILRREIQEPTILDFAGRTDLAILRTLLDHLGIDEPSPALRHQIFDAYLRHLEKELDELQNGSLFPGVAELLDDLGEDTEFHLGLLTGNFQGGALRKLARFGIDAAFDFGAFGDDDEDRNRLVEVALSRAAGVAGAAIERSQVVLVGDTPRDIECARAGGVSILAVATGLFDGAALAAHRPDALFEDLSRTEEVIRQLHRLSDPPPPGRATPRRGR